MRKKRVTALVLMALISLQMSGAANAAEGGYWDNLQRRYVRGFKNIIGSPLEIPITIQEYHEKAGPPVARHMAGFVDGCVETIIRLVSGAWDLVAGWIPGQQEGIPVDPETLF